jgi:hypothetical protein
VEILQIQRVVDHLINCGSFVMLASNLEFNDEHDALIDHNGIDALTHAWDREFKRDPAGTHIVQFALEKRGLLDPSAALKRIQVMRVLCCEMPSGCSAKKLTIVEA